MAISILFNNGEHRAEANDCQLGCKLSFICNHAITISVRHLRASPRWLYSISLSVSVDSPSATPRLNHSAVRVERGWINFEFEFEFEFELTRVRVAPVRTVNSKKQSC